MDQQNDNGHTLGGGGGASASPLTAQEIRERRLAAMGSTTSATTSPDDPKTSSDGSSTHNPSAGSSSTAATASTSLSSSLNVGGVAKLPPPQFIHHNTVEADDTEDVDLQKALALSMGHVVPEPQQAEVVIDADVTPAQPQHFAASAAAARPQTPQTSTTHPSSMMEVERSIESFSGLIEEWWKAGDGFDIASFHSFMWDTGLTTDNDKQRWVGQGISFSSDADGMTTTIPVPEAGETIISQLAKDHSPWGLTQSHGGPCGVLAAVQAEILRLLLFGRRNPLDYPPPDSLGFSTQNKADLSPELIRQALARSIAIIVARAAITASATGNDHLMDRKSASIVLPTDMSSSLLSWDDLEPWTSTSSPDTTTKSTTLTTYTISPEEMSAAQGPNKRQKTNGSHESRDERILKLGSAVTAFLLHDGHPQRTAPLDCFQRPGGVLLLVMSLVASRGQEIIRNEMDDPTGTKLTAQFGHCGQELMNLLLTGQAVSNVFDNTLTPSGELTCRGIQFRPNIGYLSQLEALRYCEVGGYYKNPQCSVWVVGSTSHFTVLFGDSSCLKESESDLLLEKCRRAFKAVEGGEEHGFISTQHLGTVIESLGLNIGGDTGVSTLAAFLEVNGAGIILWDDFWKATSRLMTGASLETVLTTDSGGAAGDQPPPLLLTNFPENATSDLDQKPSAKPAAAASAPSVESDEELARRLASEWGCGADPPAAAAARSTSPMEVESSTALSDEELARKLQAEWDAEVSGGGGGGASSVAAVGGSSPSSQWGNFDTGGTNSGMATPDMTPMSTIEDSNKPEGSIASSNNNQSHKLDFEKYGDSFEMYHYNGLRGGTLTPFRVTRLSAEEAVGASIALNRGTSSVSNHSGGSGDLEDVVRTKWPSCMINWLGKKPPYID